MTQRDSLPPTQPDVPDPRSESGSSGDQPTLPAGQPGGGPSTEPQDAPRPSETDEDDRTVLIGEEELEEPTLAWLVITSGDPVGKIFPLNADITAIGRDPQNDVALHDDACSSRHAKVRVEREEGEQRFYLLDLASTNGTFVEDERVYRHQLADGDRIAVGETELVFKKV